MEIITHVNQLVNYKSRELVNLKCKYCKNIFQRTKHDIQRNLIKCGKIHESCSTKCMGKLKTLNNTFLFNCKQCGKLTRHPKSYKSKNNFCSHSCSTTYYNKNGIRSGNQRSRLEFWVENKLKEKYPNIEFHFNRRDAIKAELDIYIPNLKLAFELNGPFHYEPIFGPEKLKSTQNNDQRKIQACIEHNIDFCIIDTSKQKYFKEQLSYQFLNIITNIIDNKLNGEAIGTRTL